MARTCLFMALLNPEDVFEDVQDRVEMNRGILEIDGNKLKLAFEPIGKDATWVEMFFSVNRVLKPFLSTLAWVTDIGVGYRPFDYVELVDGKLQSFPIRFEPPRQRRRVDTSAITSAIRLLPLVQSDPHLRWALEDYRTALREPDHELIFLYRCIEWLKVRFGGWEKACKLLGSSKKEFDTIKKPANKLYLTRHAQKGGPQPIPETELRNAHKNTRKILQRYIDYLRSQATNAV